MKEENETAYLPQASIRYAQRIIDEGHSMCMHTMHHTTLPELDAAGKLISDLNTTAGVFAGLLSQFSDTARVTQVLHPPEGTTTAAINAKLLAAGVRAIAVWDKGVCPPNHEQEMGLMSSLNCKSSKPMFLLHVEGKKDAGKQITELVERGHENVMVYYVITW